MPISVFLRVGVYDEDKFPHYHSDSALTLTAQLNGFKVFTDFESIVLSDRYSTGVGAKPVPVASEFVRSFFSVRSSNCLKTRLNFAKTFFPRRKVKFLFEVYTRTIGGFLRRYAQYHFRNRPGRLGRGDDA